MARVLVACEESQVITKAFRKLGHEAFSCDLLPCSGGHPEWHYQQDVFEIIDKGWDLMIAHPPCTYLSVAGAWAMYNKDGSINEIRMKNQNDALDFVRRLMNAPIDKIAIENPISVISSKIRKPDQIVHPYHFGEKASKSTCLWLKNLPLLNHTDIVEKGEFMEYIDTKTGKVKRMAKWMNDCALESMKEKDPIKRKQIRQTLRSKTFQGIANAISEQWSKILIN